MVQYSTLQYGAVQYNTEWCSIVHYSMRQYSTLQYGAVQVKCSKGKILNEDKNGLEPSPNPHPGLSTS